MTASGCVIGRSGNETPQKQRNTFAPLALRYSFLGHFTALLPFSTSFSAIFEQTRLLLSQSPRLTSNAMYHFASCLQQWRMSHCLLLQCTNNQRVTKIRQILITGQGYRMRLIIVLIYLSFERKSEI